MPEGFTDTFTSALVDVDGVRLHTVSGGDGPPLLLVGGWPQFWYQWRLVMPALAEHFTVIAVDPRGSGLSDKPDTGYDSTTSAAEFHRLMQILGHDRFSMIGHDIGMWTGYAMAADHPGPIERMVLVDAIVPGVSPSPPLLGDRRTSDFLWHFNFNRAHGVNEELVAGREDVYFGHQFRTKAAHPAAIAPEAVETYVRAMRLPGALKASFEYYRAIDDIMEQTRTRLRQKISTPVLAVAGDALGGENMADEVNALASEVTDVVVIENCGHYVPEEAPQALLDAALPFLLRRS
ncbi:alpha/beta hydrolase [Saccharopolyspora erythraea NRRL 2338]|uniref:Alpha/beta hydrolase n=1 Tax=Saccharopolyspora erythraea (strain ATCC 11635 / DSM 40517 / JCM 4748 / NBRC 13426 / NCIMB 8594 / NRRL 2338) TaxID=405948 RepID=A4FJD3_SACEN|nr:alpha/beta hydrolase [Saccharopolyspora erythraea NRRL 2338]